MYFNVNFNVFFKLAKVHLLVSELYIYQNVRCNDKKKRYVVYKNILAFANDTNSPLRYKDQELNDADLYSR